MGSLPDDTRCAYCDAELAGYIPDVAVGAVGRACMELSADAMVRLRLRRRARNWRLATRGQSDAPGARGAAPHPHWFREILENEALAEHIARFCIHI